MPVLSDEVDVVIGVDTHQRTHTAAIVLASGAHVATVTVDATPAGYEELFLAASAHAGMRCWAIEGCGSWGHGLVGWLHARGERVIEADRPKRPRRKMGRKSDNIDALRAAREALSAERVAIPRGQGQRDAVAAAQAAREMAISAAADSERQLLSLALTAPEELASLLRGLTTSKTVAICAEWQPEQFADPWARSIALTLNRVARRVSDLHDEAAEHEATLNMLITQWRPDVLAEQGVGPVVAAIVLSAWSHPGRIRSEAAFAMIAGCAPLEASSGETVRHRLNRGGDRQLNRAIHTIYLTRLRHDPATKAYIERRCSQGKTRREARRCVKRYIARQLYKLLESNP
jgi:transposase